MEWVIIGIFVIGFLLKSLEFTGISRVLLIGCSILSLIVGIAIMTSSSGSGSGCTICGKAREHTFQGYGYCTEHYKDAIVWVAEQTWDN